jgi:hypothetical protein
MSNSAREPVIECLSCTGSVSWRYRGPGLRCLRCRTHHTAGAGKPSHASMVTVTAFLLRSMDKHAAGLGVAPAHLVGNQAHAG